MNKWGMKGIVLGLCLSMMAPMAVAMVPGMSVEAALGGTPSTEDELLKKAKEDAPKELADYKRLIDPDNKYASKLDEIITKALAQTDNMTTATGVTNYVSKAKAQMDAIVNPPKDDSKDDSKDDGGNIVSDAEDGVRDIVTDAGDG